MNAETFCEQFATFAEAPDGVEQLRNFVLQLAVQGKLVSQDLNDEPVAEVVRRIDAIRGLKKPNSESPAKSDDLPRGWMRVRMSQIADHRLGKMLDKAKNKGMLFPYLRNTNVQWWRFALDDLKEMRFGEDELDEYEVRTGDLLVCEGGEPGRCAVWSDPNRRLVFQKAIHRVRPLEGICPYFLAVRLRLDAVTKRLDEQFTGATIKHFTGQELARYTFPLPPLAEQRRIVAKVDQLMGLCDELSARQAARREAHSTLVATTLDRLVSPSTPAEFPTHANRLRNHFDQLFDTPTTIPQLRQSILQLAVQGQLVQQEASDEPASSLIETIMSEKEELVRDRKIRNSNSHTTRDAGRDIDELPPGWSWATLDDLTEIGTGGTPPTGSKEYYTGGTIPWVTSAATNSEFIAAPDTLITKEAVANCRLKIYPAGSLVVALYGQGKTRGQVGQLMFDSTTNQACAVIRFFGTGLGIRDYVRLVFRKKYHELRDLAAGGAQPNLSGGMIRLMRVPLPPLAEQKRIVAKVTELLSLCDALEAKLTQAESASSELLAAAVHHLLAAGANSAVVT